MAQRSYQAEITIKKLVGEVFEFVSNLRNLSLWSGASAVEVFSETPNKVGSIYKVTFSTLLTKSSVPVEITGYTFPNSFTFRDNSKLILFNYIFEQAEEGTKVSLSCELDDNSFPFSQLKMDKLLTDLKKYLEAAWSELGVQPLTLKMLLDVAIFFSFFSKIIVGIFGEAFVSFLC